MIGSIVVLYSHLRSSIVLHASKMVEEPPTSTNNTAVPSENGNSSLHSGDLEKEVKAPDAASVRSSPKENATADPEMSALEKIASLDNPNEQEEYPGGLKLAIITLSLSMSVLLVALDNTIIATAIPRITG